MPGLPADPLPGGGSCRVADEQIYLRAGSLNLINGMVGLNFSCDGSHYLSARDFLNASEARWFGSPE